MKTNKNLLDGGAAGPRDTRAALRFLATSAAVSLVALRFCLERFIVVGGLLGCTILLEELVYGV